MSPNGNIPCENQFEDLAMNPVPHLVHLCVGRTNRRANNERLVPPPSSTTTKPKLPAIHRSIDREPTVRIPERVSCQRRTNEESKGSGERARRESARENERGRGESGERKRRGDRVKERERGREGIE